VSTAYLGLGGNLGNRRQYLAGAIHALNSEQGIRVESVSSVYETKPVGVIDQPDFLNLVAQIATELSARELLARCLRIEADLGRVRTERWGPRTIDIDVLWFDEKTVNEPDLVLPHPRMLARAFVLVPLAEIAPLISLASMRIDVLAAKLDQTGLCRLGPLDSLLE
jgi:2-amino-4-hydroxy-6-hydroxymethyldihydropteridine diphosphokinase